MNLKLGRLDVPARGMVFHYYRTAKSSQRDQLRMIRDLGFDVIHTEESPVAPGKYRGSLAPVMAWNHIETGKNQYDWGFLDQLVEDCDAVGLQVLHDICLVAHLPEWVAQENAGTEIVYPTGEIVGPWQRGDFCHVQYQMRSFSLAHPACRAAAADFLGKVAARYAGSRAVPGYILVEELCLSFPHTKTWYGQDVSPATEEGFTGYLQEKYGKVDAMNAVYGGSYRDFRSAACDRGRFKPRGQLSPLWTDWCYWRSAYVARFIKDIRDSIKRADPEALVVVNCHEPYAGYWLVHGVRLEEMTFCDVNGIQHYEGTQDCVRNLMTWRRVAKTAVGMSNLNAFYGEIELPQLRAVLFRGPGHGVAVERDVRLAPLQPRGRRGAARAARRSRGLPALPGVDQGPPGFPGRPDARAGPDRGAQARAVGCDNVLAGPRSAADAAQPQPRRGLVTQRRRVLLDARRTEHSL